MNFRRTSIKTLFVGILFFLFYVLATLSAERYDKSINRITFGHLGRPFNYLDYFAILSIVLSGSFLLISIWFFRKND